MKEIKKPEGDLKEAQGNIEEDIPNPFSLEIKRKKERIKKLEAELAELRGDAVGQKNTEEGDKEAVSDEDNKEAEKGIKVEKVGEEALGADVEEPTEVGSDEDSKEAEKKQRTATQQPVTGLKPTKLTPTQGKEEPTNNDANATRKKNATKEAKVLSKEDLKAEKEKKGEIYADLTERLKFKSLKNVKVKGLSEEALRLQRSVILDIMEEKKNEESLAKGSAKRQLSNDIDSLLELSQQHTEEINKIEEAKPKEEQIDPKTTGTSEATGDINGADARDIPPPEDGVSRGATIDGSPKKRKVWPEVKRFTAESEAQYTREELLNAAEVLCRYNSAAYKNNEEGNKKAQTAALEMLKKGYSEDEIKFAVKVSDTRKQLAGIDKELSRIEQEYKDALDNSDITPSEATAKFRQQLETVRQKTLHLHNDYHPLLMDLKIANIRRQFRDIEKYKDHDDYEKKALEIELTASSMVTTEVVKWNDADILSQKYLKDAELASEGVTKKNIWEKMGSWFSRTSEKAGGAFKKVFGGYMKMGLAKRMGILGGVAGGIAAFVPGAAVAVGLGTLGYFAIKGIRAVTGSIVTYWTIKNLYMPIAKGAYKGDSTKTANKQRQEVVNSSATQDLLKLSREEMSPEEEEETLRRIASKNIEISESFVKEIKKNERLFKINSILGSIVVGALVGYGARNAFDYLAGPDGLGILHPPTPGIGDVENPDDGNGPGTGTVPPPGGNGPGTGTVPPPGGNGPGTGTVPPPGGNGPGTGTVPPPGGNGPGTGTIPDLETGPSGPSNQEILDAATIGEGEGIEHALIRQLTLDPERFGFKGNINDPQAVRGWAGVHAHLIAIDQKYVNIDSGAETRVFDMGPDGPKGNPAYVLTLDSNGKPSVQEYFEGKGTGNGGWNSVYEYDYRNSVYKPILGDAGEGETVTTPTQNIDLIDGKQNSGASGATEGTQQGGTSNLDSVKGKGLVNPEGLSEAINEDLINRAKEIANTTIDKMFPGEQGEATFNNLNDNVPAHTLLSEIPKGINPTFANIASYVDQLHEVTGLEPTQRGLLGFTQNETIYEYMLRTTMYAQENGLLDKIQPIINK
ncbi:MAG: hypothetical protein K9L98_00010 [Candidatus Pacebacteria bacterium]|nr:hypothetical protein [Candidatus Paceibacterota bacterium]MCF7862387.1 hypothetical protein [Candidatus Paceibacterota bacterium]